MESPPIVVEPTEADYHERKVRSSAGWFYWIAVLSGVTVFINLLGTDWGFMLSMGTANVLAAIIHRTELMFIKVVCLALTVFILAVMVLCGYFGSRKSMIAFTIGLAVLLVDSMWFFAMLPLGVPSLLFRAWSIYALIGGLQALRALKNLSEKDQGPDEPHEDQPPMPSNVPG
ncbi:MAG: hypothetical protein JSS66_18295 [Armatimonadetes bacterium]|nr:hypothetical protein [Armatimonadota bacterium]